MTEILSQFPPVTVIIPTWNAASFVKKALEALVVQELVSMEILVVDNGVVNDETNTVVENFINKYPFVRLLSYKKQLGYAGAVNEGVRNAKHSLIAICNNDNLPTQSWLSELLQVHQLNRWNGKKIAITSSFVPRSGTYSHHKTEYNFCGRVLYSDSEMIPNKNFPVFHPDGSSFLFDKTLLGLPYKDEYFIYHEDSSIGWRARMMGYEVVMAKKSFAETFDGGSTRRIPFHTAYYSERNRWLNAFCFPQASTILKLMPVWWFDLVVSFLFGQRKWARLKAWLWIIGNPLFVMHYRKELQAQRRVDDSEILPLITGQYLEVHGKSISARAKRCANNFFKIYFQLVRLPLKT